MILLEYREKNFSSYLLLGRMRILRYVISLVSVAAFVSIFTKPLSAKLAILHIWGWVRLEKRWISLLSERQISIRITQLCYEFKIMNGWGGKLGRNPISMITEKENVVKICWAKVRKWTIVCHLIHLKTSHLWGFHQLLQKRKQRQM